MTDREIEEQIVDPAMQAARTVLAERSYGSFRLGTQDGIRPLGEVTPVVAALRAHACVSKPSKREGARPTKPLKW